MLVKWSTNHRRLDQNSTFWRRSFVFLLLLVLTVTAIDDQDESFPVTECDHVFEASKSQRGQFSLPMLSKHATKSTYNAETSDSKLVGSYLPANIQCVYTFVASGKGQRVKLEITQFQLSGTIDSCDLEYIDIYSDIQSVEQDLLQSSPSRFCGTVAPAVRVSLHNVIVVIFHSRVGRKRTEKFKLSGRYSFISEARYIPGSRLGESNCGFLIEPTRQRSGQILSATYPGAYPNNFYCFYLLKGNPNDRIRVFFKDFDIYFGGEHCPYDSVTIYDGDSNRSPIIRKLCGLQQRLELFSFGSDLFIEFNTTDPAKNEPRGFVIDYEFSESFVDIKRLIGGQKEVSHLRGSECDVRVQSKRETVHYITSPNYPQLYPVNTSCTYILDGLQGDQNLEKVILHFETFNIPTDLSSTTTSLAIPSSQQGGEGDECSSFVGVAKQESSIKAVLANNEESFYDATLCDRPMKGSPKLGPYSSRGPRMVIVFGSLANSLPQAKHQGPFGFKARVEFKTDFGVPGEPMGTSNECLFKFVAKSGSFNSPRYPANYPTNANCTYWIKGEVGEQILLHFEQFALFEESSKDACNDWLEIHDVFYTKNGTQRSKLQAKHCWTVFPGPTISVYGSHEMRVVFFSSSSNTANGFNAMYIIRKTFQESVPKIEGSDPHHCGHIIEATPEITNGSLSSPGFPVKYSQNQICDWKIIARPGHQILLQLNFMDVEGEITEQKISCKNAVIRIHQDYSNRTGDVNICGTNYAIISPMLSINNTIRISFLTAPEKVNGLRGFNFTWTEVRVVKQDSECSDDSLYLCSYSRLCINSKLRCNGDDNCGQNDDSDEAHCNIAEKATDLRTITFAAIFSGFICLFILIFFCIMFKEKFDAWLNRKKRKNQPTANGTQNTDRATTPSKKPALAQKQASELQTRQRQRQPFRQQQPVTHKISKSTLDSGLLPSPATSRLLHHGEVSTINPLVRFNQAENSTLDEHTFYG